MAERAALGKLLEDSGVADDAPAPAKKPAKTAEKPPIPKALVENVSRQAGLDTRTPPAAPTDRPRGRGRRRTKRTEQFNCKIEAELMNRIVRLADAEDWIYAEVLERGISALERELGID
jgi:hypothetical protein